LGIEDGDQIDVMTFVSGGGGEGGGDVDHLYTGV
jgi:hypothetical protein